MTDMTEIEDIQGIIMGGVDQPILDPHNLMVNTNTTQQTWERRIGRLEHRNTYLKRENEQLREIVTTAAPLCRMLVLLLVWKRDACLYCELINGWDSPSHSSGSNCPVPLAEKVLELQAKMDTANKHLGGE